jgi:hypothetical protein
MNNTQKDSVINHFSSIVDLMNNDNKNSKKKKKKKKKKGFLRRGMGKAAQFMEQAEKSRA